jgi:hypothetical protein
MGKNTISNRYLIYKLLGRQVECDPTCLCKHHRKFSGVVESVSRDIFGDMILVTVSGRRYSFDEPSKIFEKNSSIIFVYGEVDDLDDSDDTFFKEVRDSAYGDTITDILNRPDGQVVKRVVFSLVGVN